MTLVRASAVRSPLAGQQQREAADHFVRATGERAQGAAGIGLVARLAVDDAVEHDDRVAPEQRLARAGAARRARLAQRVLDRDPGGVLALLELARRRWRAP